MAVRNESVRLSLTDAGYSTGMAKATAQTILFDKSLNRVDGTNVGTADSIRKTVREVDGLGSAFRRNTSDLDQFSGRLGIWRDAILGVGPALVPIGAVAVPAVTGLASAFGFAAIGAGSAMVAFQGVGDALKAMRKAELEPTAENLEAARQAMEQISPAARDFVTELNDMMPALKAVRDAAAEGLFSELTPSLDTLEKALPRVSSLFEAFGRVVGDLGGDAIESLTGAKWAEFFQFVETEGPQALGMLGRALGDVAHGFAELWMAFGPLNQDFTRWLNDSADAFDNWASGLSQTEGFDEFVAYINENGPRVAEALGSIGNALIQVVQAVAPLGGPTLEIISSFADAVALLAGSSVGAPLLALAAGMAVVSRATKVLGPGIGSLSDAFLDLRTSPNKAATAMERFGGAAKLAAGGAGLGLFAHSLTQTNQELRTFESVAGGALLGAVAGPWGAAIGGAIGLITSLGAASDGSAQRVESLTAALVQSKGAIDDTVRALAVTSLEEAGVFRDAEKLGLDLELVTNAALGNADAIAEVTEALSGYGRIVQSVGGSKGSFQAGYDEDAHAAARLAEAISGTSDEVSEATAGARRHAEAMGEQADAGHEAADGMRDAAAATRSYSEALADFSGWLDKRAALRNYDDAVKELTKSLRNGFTRKDVENIDAVGRGIEQTLSTLEGRGRRNDFLDGSIASLRELASDAGPKAQAEIRELIGQLRQLDRANAEPEIDADPSAVANAVAAVGRYLASINGDRATVYIDVRQEGQGFRPPSALGNIFTYARGGMDRPNSHWPEFAGPGPTRVWREPETKGESYIPHANDHRRPRAKSILEQTAGMFGGQVQWFANGGMDIGTAASATLSEVALIMREIRRLQHMLDAEGKNELSKQRRKVVELELKAAEKRLKLAEKEEELQDKLRDQLRERRSNLIGIGREFSLSDLVPDDRPVTVTQGARQEIAQLRRDILAAGGVWTKGLTRWAKELVAAASALDDVNAQLVAENAKRDQLVAAIADQQQALDQLNSTMTSFAASVANNFLTNPFNQTITGGAPSAALTSAQEQLAAIRNSATGDSVAAAALASQLIAQIKKLQNGSGSATGLAAFDQTLNTDISNIAAMNAALDQLAAKGLDVSGALGGLYEQLALTGDLQTAQQLAELSAAEIDQREKLFALRQDQAAAIGAKVTQNIYGQQQAQMQVALANSQAELVRVNANIATLERTATQLGVDIRAMAPDVAELLKPQTDKIGQKIDNLGINIPERLRRMALGN